VFRERVNWVNATGVRGFLSIGECLEEFSLLFSIRRGQIRNLKVDNITAYGRFLGANFDFPRLLNRPPDGVKSVFYNPQSFPGAVLKFECGGCLLLFPSRRYSVVGAKRYGTVLIVYNAVLRALVAGRNL
jgi:TATA-box binding protein (TBP) (component of TFIID and TFIIIB)